MEIRKLKKEDLPIRVEWMNHPRIYEHMHFALPVTLEKTEAWYETLSARNRCDMAFLIDQQVVAMGGLTNIDSTVRKAELYIFVSPDSQHAGIGTQATRKLCAYGFSVLKLDKIYLITNEDNLPAQKVYTKCGFVLEGKLRNEYIDSDGNYRSRYYYGLLKEEWHESID